MTKEDEIYICVMEYHSTLKKRMKSCHLQQVREKQIPHGMTYMWNGKNKANMIKQKQTHRYRKQTGDCQRRGKSGDE